MSTLIVLMTTLLFSNFALAYGQGKGHDAGKGNPDQGVGCPTAMQASVQKTNNPHCNDVPPPPPPPPPPPGPGLVLVDLWCSAVSPGNIEIFNDGPDTAHGVTVDLLSQGTHYDFPIGTLEANAQVSAFVGAGGTAVISSTETDANPNDNSCTVPGVPG